MSSPRSDDTELLADQETISPVRYEPPVSDLRSQPVIRIRRSSLIIASALAVIALFAAFLLSAQSVQLRLEPADTTVSVSGGFSLQIADRLLLREGSYRFELSADGYYPQTVEQQISNEASQNIAATLQKLPGRVLINLQPEHAQAFIDGKPLEPDVDGYVPIEAGEHQLQVEATRYQRADISLSVEGMAKEQVVDVQLLPDWGQYELDSAPRGATLWVDGEELGKTPTTIKLLSGERIVSLRLDGYETDSLTVDAVAGEQRDLGVRSLRIADGRARIQSVPDGASITINGEFAGKTPLDVSLRSGERYTIEAFKAGHKKRSESVQLGSGEQRTLTLKLSPVTGEISVQVEPDDAEVWLGSRKLSTGSGQFALPAVRQQLSIRRSGFAEQQHAVTPRPGLPQTLRVRLQTTEQAQIAAIKPRIQSPAGQELVLLRPSPFTMGASRREAGRRANEVVRKVTLKKPYYLSVNEVTNAEFRAFRATHNSGNFKGKSLNGESQPAVNLSWQDAALYCNWLSEKEGLEPFYIVQNNTVTGFVADAPGYRLPSEAEWAWAARMQSDGTLQKFSWGNTPPPPKGKVGNYADRSAANLLGDVMQGYDDGYPVAAPVGSFKPDRHGLADMGGNAAEWIHDFYESALGQSTLGEDPLGPVTGAHHLIRGPSWRHGGLSEIRLSFRDYGKDPRPDLGFRIARYLQ